MNSGAFTPQQAMDRLAEEMDQVMARMQEVDEKANVYGGCGPRLNPESDPTEWLGKPNGPKAKLENEKPQGETIDYDELVKRWAESQLSLVRPTPPGRVHLCRAPDRLECPDRRRCARARHDP